MFEAELKEKLQRIFGVRKATYEQPSEAKEQEVIFISIETATSKVTQGLGVAMAQGSFSIFASSEKMPFGYINKRINLAANSDTKDFVFYNIDENQKYFGNLVERKSSFTFFYRGDYDPNQGDLTSIELEFT